MTVSRMKDYGLSRDRSANVDNGITRDARAEDTRFRFIFPGEIMHTWRRRRGRKEGEIYRVNGYYARSEANSRSQKRLRSGSNIGATLFA